MEGRRGRRPQLRDEASVPAAAAARQPLRAPVWACAETPAKCERALSGKTAVARARWARPTPDRQGPCPLTVALCIYLAALAGVHGIGEQGPLGTRCLPEVLSADGGRVVIYDTVVSVPARRLFLIGPDDPLWVVQSVPAQQANAVTFSRTFDGRPNPDVGSTCRFSVAPGPREQDAEATTDTNLLSVLAFIHDPISNINVAFCSVPDEAMAALHLGSDVSAAVTLVPMDKSEGQKAVELSVPVCIADGAGLRDRPPVYASLCCIIRNEARYLQEWLEYSRMIGVEHFYLYDHASSDNTGEILSGYIDAGIVTLHQWEFPGYPQREAHSHCTHRYAHATTWLGLMDVDEFIVPVHHSTLVPLLTYFELEPVVLRLQAAMFGTSGHKVRPGGLVVEHYVVRNLSTYWPINPQHKVWFRPGGNIVMMPSIHAVDVVAEGVTHLDVHENDVYYNHYRTKSRQDHQDDPLRSKMAILEADEVVDLQVRQRFLAPLKARLQHCRAKGICRPGASPDDGQAPYAGDTSVDDTADSGGSVGVEGGWRGSEAVGGLIMAGPPLPATFLERTHSHFDECPQVAEAILRILPQRDTGPDMVIDLDPGTGYYVSHLHQRGCNVTGLDSDGELSDSLLRLDLRETSAWRRGGAQDQEAKARLPRGSVLLVQVPQPVPAGLRHVLDLVASVCTGRFIIGWPAGAGWKRLEESLWLAQLDYNQQVSAWLQEKAQMARHNTRMYRHNSNVNIKRCRGTAEFLVFERMPLADDTGRERGAAGKEDRGSRSSAPELLWPHWGLVLPALSQLDVEWHERARGAMTRRQRQGQSESESETSASDDALRDDLWELAAAGDCALLLVDGEQRGRACGGAGIVDVSHLSGGLHTISAVPVRFVSHESGRAGAGIPWARDSGAAVRSSRVWIGGPRTAIADANRQKEEQAQGPHTPGAATAAVKVVGIRGSVRFVCGWCFVCGMGCALCPLSSRCRAGVPASSPSSSTPEHSTALIFCVPLCRLLLSKYRCQARFSDC